MWGKSSESNTNSILTKSEDQSELSDAFISANGFCLILSHQICALFDRIETLYFLNQTDVKSLLVSKSQLLQYPTYVPNRHGTPFQTRFQMLEYVGASHLLSLFLKLSDQLNQDNMGEGEIFFFFYSTLSLSSLFSFFSPL
jgi:hypothetical protein